MDTNETRSNTTRSGAAFHEAPAQVPSHTASDGNTDGKTPTRFHETPLFGYAPLGTHPGDGIVSPQTPANTLQKCLAGEGTTTAPPLKDTMLEGYAVHSPLLGNLNTDGKTSTRFHETPLGTHPGHGRVSPLIPANTSQKCLAGEGITAPPLKDGGAPLGPPR